MTDADARRIPDRRTVLRYGAAGALTLAAPAVLRAQSSAAITFSFAPDPTGSLQSLMDAFNEQSGGITVSLRAMPERTDEYYRQLVSDFEVASGDIDVIGADNIWTAPFAYQGWVRNLTRQALSEYARDTFTDASLRTARYRNSVWAVPWFTAAGMVYYRRDLLNEAGLEPPQTWNDLKSAALQLKESGAVANGFVFQGAAYEGGVTNALEYIWSTGGRLMTQSVTTTGTFVATTTRPNVITADSADAARGLDIARDMVASGAAPAEVASYDEAASLDVFAAGDAAFLRSWPYVYGLLGTRDLPFSLEDVGVMAIPSEAGGRSYSTLGGWNLMINTYSQNPEAAWEFVRYLASAEGQKLHAIEGKYLPTRAALYQDEEVREAIPILALGEQALANARARPQSPFYMSMSPRIARVFTAVLRQELTGAEAVDVLRRDLRILLQRRS